jgi:exosortase F-associated protein
MQLNQSNLFRLFVGVACAAGLVFVFLFQQTEFIRWSEGRGVESFLLNKAIRYILNDFCMIGLIYSIFNQRKYVIFAFYVQIAGIIFFLLPYFILKLYYPHYNGPLLSFLHRLIVNPLLMLLLIPAFMYQKSQG